MDRQTVEHCGNVEISSAKYFFIKKHLHLTDGVCLSQGCMPLQRACGPPARSLRLAQRQHHRLPHHASRQRPRQTSRRSKRRDWPPARPPPQPSPPRSSFLWLLSLWWPSRCCIVDGKARKTFPGLSPKEGDQEQWAGYLSSKGGLFALSTTCATDWGGRVENRSSWASLTRGTTRPQVKGSVTQSMTSQFQWKTATKTAARRECHTSADLVDMFYPAPKSVQCMYCHHAFH